MKNWLDSLQIWADAGFPLSTLHKGLILFFVITACLIFFGYRVATDVEVTPCSPSGYPARCYYVSQEMCQAVWSKAEVTCKEFIDSLSLPPGRLTGPIAFKCQLMNLDKAFGQSRKTNPECDEMARSLDEWKRRNDLK